ncbi:hypothetical protein ACP70R_005013 [Stipagrostis hirtigluma subsp. patula]
MADCNGNSSASPSGEETFIEKKYGGIAPKKPLIAKDHERAYFDSADWVLGKQAASSSGARAAIESLKPKLKDASSPASPSQADLCVQLSHCNKVYWDILKCSEDMEPGIRYLAGCIC